MAAFGCVDPHVIPIFLFRCLLVPTTYLLEGAIVIDIGINAVPLQDGRVKLVGDVDTASVEPVAEALSPVPGGVGPITDIWVLHNTVTAAWLQAGPPPRPRGGMQGLAAPSGFDWPPGRPE